MNPNVLCEHYESVYRDFTKQVQDQTKRIEEIHNIKNYNIELKHIMNIALHMTDPKHRSKSSGDQENPVEPGILSMALLNKQGGSGSIALSHIAGTCM